MTAGETAINLETHKMPEVPSLDILVEEFDIEEIEITEVSE